ncbi:MAG: ATP-binding cassette domain-containing protein [Lachnospiraceae bacterium]|nr:ATP-binding cassette domain-containing protein [Lachnospiraceae bacterium]
MRIISFKLYKPYIKISELDLHFAKGEIYLISGPNGHGKSTLMESLVFENHDAEFDTDEEKQLYLNERGRLFSYLPQNIVEYPGTVSEYIRQFRKDIKDCNIPDILADYDCEGISKDSKFLNLSGGERIKVALISILLKGTPYIFLDEPSNNLDKYTIAWLKETLVKASVGRCIIMISHSKELASIATQHITFDSEILNEKKKNENKQRNDNERIGDLDSSKAVNRLWHSKYNYIYSVMLLLIVFVFCFSIIKIENGLLEKKKIPPKDEIVTYIGDGTFGELNEYYTKERKIKVPKEKYDIRLSYSIVKKLIDEKAVKKAYFIDYEKRFGNAYDENGKIDPPLDNPQICSIPECIYSDSSFSNKFLVENLTFLEKGRLPHDGASEVVASEKILEAHGLKKEDVIGNVLTLESKEYKIVGIGTEDVCLVSFEEAENRGIYCYKQETYDDFVFNYESKFGELDVSFLITEEGKEKEVLEYLIKNYPATNYYSHYFAVVLRGVFNKKIFFSFMIATLIASVFFGTTQAMCLGSHLISMSNRVVYCAEYYTNHSIKRKYYKKYNRYIILNLIVALSLVIMIGIIKRPETYTMLCMLLFTALIQLPTIIILCKQKKKLWERNMNDC